MKKLIIYEYQAKQIEDTLRIVANILGSRTKETSADRDVMQSIGMIKAVIEEKPQTQIFR